MRPVNQTAEVEGLITRYTYISGYIWIYGPPGSCSLCPYIGLITRYIYIYLDIFGYMGPQAAALSLSLYWPGIRKVSDGLEGGGGGGGGTTTDPRRCSSSRPVLWIRTHFKRSRIQPFFSMRLRIHSPGSGLRPFHWTDHGLWECD